MTFFLFFLKESKRSGLGDEGLPPRLLKRVFNSTNMWITTWSLYTMFCFKAIKIFKIDLIT